MLLQERFENKEFLLQNDIFLTSILPSLNDITYLPLTYVKLIY